jgi:probable rRNA maturation factor
MTRKKPVVPRIAIVVAEPRWRTDPKALSLIRRAARLGMTTVPTSPLERRAGRLAPKGEAVLTILLAGDPELQALNLKFRKKDRPTNVLSFPAADEFYIGDIALAYQTIRAEARAQKKRFSHHAAHMAVHGVLHLLGFDHKKKSEAQDMERRETMLLSKLKIAPPYGGHPLSRRVKGA